MPRVAVFYTKYDYKLDGKPEYHVWHDSISCYERAQASLGEYAMKYGDQLGKKRNSKLFINAPTTSSKRLLYPCPNCVLPLARLPLPIHDVNVYKVHFDTTGKISSKIQSFSLKSLQKPQLIHFPHGIGTYWVLKNPNGGWDKYRNMTQKEREDMLPNHGINGSWLNRDSNGYDGFNNTFMLQHFGKQATYKESFIWNVENQAWDLLPPQILNPGIRTDL